MNTDSASWSQLSSDIDQYRNKAKKNLQLYERRRFDALYKKKIQMNPNRDNSSAQPKFDLSLNLIREKQQNEKMQTSAILNKVSFLKVQRDRKVQSTQRARNKLSRVLSIRRMSSEDKLFCEHEIKTFRQRNLTQKRDLTERIKSERSRIDEERRKILSANCYSARETREESVQNQETIQYEKMIDISRRQKMVEKGQHEYEEIIQKNKDRQEEIKKQGKFQHNSYKKKQFIKYENARKMNLKIIQYFKKQSTKLLEQTNEAQQNLRNYERMLFLRKKSQKNRDENKVIESFLLTQTPKTATTTKQSRSVRRLTKDISQFRR